MDNPLFNDIVYYLSYGTDMYGERILVHISALRLSDGADTDANSLRGTYGRIRPAGIPRMPHPYENATL